MTDEDVTDDFEHMVQRLMTEPWVDYNPRDWPWERMQLAVAESERRREAPRRRWVMPWVMPSLFHVKPDAVVSGRERLGE